MIGEYSGKSFLKFLSRFRSRFWSDSWWFLHSDKVSCSLLSSACIASIRFSFLASLTLEHTALSVVCTDNNRLRNLCGACPGPSARGGHPCRAPFLPHFLSWLPHPPGDHRQERLSFLKLPCISCLMKGSFPNDSTVACCPFCPFLFPVPCTWLTWWLPLFDPCPFSENCDVECVTF